MPIHITNVIREGRCAPKLGHARQWIQGPQRKIFYVAKKRSLPLMKIKPRSGRNPNQKILSTLLWKLFLSAKHFLRMHVPDSPKNINFQSRAQNYSHGFHLYLLQINWDENVLQKHSLHFCVKAFEDSTLNPYKINKNEITSTILIFIDYLKKYAA